MELQVKRDSYGNLKEVNILDLSTKEWVILQTALEKCLEDQEKSLETFENYLEEEIAASKPTEDTLKVIKIIQDNIKDYKTILKDLKEK